MQTRPLSTQRPAAQRGISFIGLLFFGVILALLAIVGARVVPTVSEFFTIKRISKNAARQGDTVPAVRAAFDKAAEADYVSSISGKDLTVIKQGDKVVVSFAYEKEIPLFGPAYLLLKYSGSSDKL